jgi:hypothetical protein
MSYLVSERGHPLLLQRLPRSGERPVVTVECYEKWYHLYLVYKIHDELAVEATPFPEHDTLTPYIDHVPNPAVVKAWAESKGYYLDELAYQMMIGRWELAREE